MTVSLDSITTSALSLALDAANARHRVIATNIANANTKGYVPQALSFEGNLEQARRNLREQGQLDPLTLRDMSLRVDPVLQTDGQPAKVELDVEVAHLTSNAVQYQALIKGLTRHLSVMSIAVSDGKR